MILTDNDIDELIIQHLEAKGGYHQFAHLVEAAVIRKLATVSTEPLAYVSEDELGYVEEGGRCGAFYGVKTNPDLKDAPGFVAVYTGPQLVALLRQALEALEKTRAFHQQNWSSEEITPKLTRDTIAAIKQHLGEDHGD